MKMKFMYCASAIAVVAASTLMLTASQSQAPAKYDPAIETQTTIGDGFTFAAVGDVIMPLPTSNWSDAAFQSALKPLKDSDVAYGQFEMTSVDLDDFKGAYFPGPAMISDPSVAEDFKKMGFDAFSRATNHGFDLGLEGMLASNAHLEDAGLVVVGSGKNYGAAWAPRYFMTPKGRVAFVATTTAMWAQAPVLARAAVESGEASGHGGVALMRVAQTFVVPRSLQSALDTIRKALPTGGGLYAPLDDTADRISVMGQKFRFADVLRPEFSYDPNKEDVAAALKSVREGKLKSDFLSFGMHVHEHRYPDKPDTDPIPGDFLQPFAHQVIDAGADQFVGTGVHNLRGIEIYKGRVIFYGLGEYFRQMDINKIGRGPARGDQNSDPEKFESVLAVTRYQGGKLAEVKLYPVEARETARMALRGLPQTPSSEVAQKILKRLQGLSEPYGTKINVVGDVGYITLQGAPPAAQPARRRG